MTSVCVPSPLSVTLLTRPMYSALVVPGAGVSPPELLEPPPLSPLSSLPEVSSSEGETGEALPVSESRSSLAARLFSAARSRRDGAYAAPVYDMADAVTTEASVLPALSPSSVTISSFSPLTRPAISA